LSYSYNQGYIGDKKADNNAKNSDNKAENAHYMLKTRITMQTSLTFYKVK